MKSSVFVMATALMLAATAMHATDALAAGFSASTAVGACRGSSPVANANLRKRPLGVRNEGATAVFVSCAAQWGYNPTQIFSAQVILNNTNAQATDVTCTLVDGVANGAAFYFPKTMSLAANNLDGFVWRPEDYGGTSFSGFENFSCSLPPGIEINGVGFEYHFDIYGG